MPTSNWFDRVRVSALFSQPARKQRRKSPFDRTAFAVESLESRLYLSAGVLSHDQVLERIVNPTPTNAFPSVGIVGDTTDMGHCTGTLISPRHVLTAAHCVDTTPQTQGTFRLDDGRVFQTSRIFVHPNWSPNSPGLFNDIAIMELSTDVTGVTPSQIYREVPQVGQLLTLVGYGAVGDGNTGHDNSFGVKNMGTTPIDGVEALRITWNFDDNTESNTAPGDSGGPAFVTVNGQMFIAGITSGGTLFSAAIGDFSFDTRIDAFADYIDSIVNVNILDVDPSDSAFGAFHIQVPSQTQSEINPSNDQDWFSFDAVEGKRYSFVTEDLSHPDTTLSLFDRNGVTLLESDNNSSPTSGASIEWEATHTGRFFLRVTSTESANPAQVGDYRLNVSLAAAGPVPVILAPMGDIIDNTPTFEWTPVIDAVRYELQVVNLTTGGTAIHNTDITDTSFTDPNRALTPNQVYRVRVRGIAANGTASPFSEPVDFTVSPIEIGIPRIESLTATTPSTLPVFQWTATDGAAVYDIWVNNVTTGQNGIIRDQGVRSNTFTPPVPLVRGHNYIWTVRAIHGSGEAGEWAPHARFTVVSDLGVPTALTPGGSNEGPNPTFTWTEVTGAVAYDLAVNNLTTGVAQVIREKTVPGTSFQPVAGLTPGDLYIWAVRAVDGSGIVGDFSAHRTFRVASNLSTPEIQSPTGNIDTERPTFTWRGDPNAVRYDVWVNVFGSNQLVFRNQNVTSTEYTHPVDLPAGKTYIWTVRGIDASGNGSHWATHEVFTIDVNIGKTTLIAPSGSEGSGSPTFRWTAVPGAARYDLWVNDLTTGESAVVREKELTTTSYTATNLQHGHSYIWTVEAIHATGQGGGQAPHKMFTIAPASPTLIGPTGSSTPLPTFEWEAVTGATRYTLYVATVDTANANSRVVIYRENLTSTSFASDVTLAPGQYQWWVRATNAGGLTGRWSNVGRFEILSTSTPLASLQSRGADPSGDEATDRAEPVHVDQQDLLFAQLDDANGVFAALYNDRAPDANEPTA